MTAHLPLQYSWIWLLIVLLTNRETCLKNTSATIRTSISANEEAALKIEELLALISSMRNFTPSVQQLNASHKFSVHNGHQDKGLGFINISDNMKPMLILKQLSQLCKILNPIGEGSNWPSNYNYMPMIGNHHVDHFGCKNLWSNLASGFATNENSTVLLENAETKLIHWGKKLQKSQEVNVLGITFSNNELSSRPQNFVHPTLFIKIPEETTSQRPLSRWNKGLTRYDTSWVKTDKLSLGKSAIRILPAVPVIVFLVFCWYFFVYRRMKQRQQRARALLNQYQAILSGNRGLSSSIMIVSNSSAFNDNTMRLFNCSSSTYDSCLNENCTTVDNSSCAEHCAASNAPTPSGNAHSNSVPNGNVRPIPSQLGRQQPPRYDEIFPPAYDSIFGTVV